MAINHLDLSYKELGGQMVSRKHKRERLRLMFFERLVLRDTTSLRVIILQREVIEVTGYVRMASRIAVCLRRKFRGKARSNHRWLGQ